MLGLQLGPPWDGIFERLAGSLQPVNGVGVSQDLEARSHQGLQLGPQPLLDHQFGARIRDAREHRDTSVDMFHGHPDSLHLHIIRQQVECSHSSVDEQCVHSVFDQMIQHAAELVGVERFILLERRDYGGYNPV